MEVLREIRKKKALSSSDFYYVPLLFPRGGVWVGFDYKQLLVALQIDSSLVISDEIQ